jgi:hypothetical protein
MSLLLSGICGLEEVELTVPSRDGDLTHSSSASEVPLYSFAVHPESLWKTTTGVEMDISPRLPLEVGGEGIVGRRVSVVSELEGGERRIAEGIIGWN